MPRDWRRNAFGSCGVEHVEDEVGVRDVVDPRKPSLSNAGPPTDPRLVLGRRRGAPDRIAAHGATLPPSGATVVAHCPWTGAATRQKDVRGRLQQTPVTLPPVSRVLTSLPVGERVGIAFSGGLDTTVAVAWIREKGAMPYALTADLGQYDEPDVAGIPARAKAVGAEEAILVDCRPQLVHEGLVALRCGAFHVSSGGKTYFNTTPLGRAVTGTMLVHAMHEHGVDIWGDGSTYKGNDIERFFRYGLLGEPGAADLQAVARPAVRRGARRPQGDERVARRARPPVPRERREGVLDGREHLGRDARGEGARAPRPLDAHRRADHGRRALGPGGRDRAGDGDACASRRAGRSRSNGVAYDDRVELVLEANAIGGRHGLGMSDQIENRIIEAKSRGIYEAPGMALLFIAYERLVNAIHNEATIDEYRTAGRRLGRLLYEGRWFDPQALMLRQSLAELDRERRDRRGDGRAPPRRRLHDPRHASPTNATYHPERLSMERVEDAAFGPLDRIGQLTMRLLDLEDSRDEARALRTARPDRAATRRSAQLAPGDD